MNIKMLLQLSFQQYIRLKVLAAMLKLESISCWSGSFLCAQWLPFLPLKSHSGLDECADPCGTAA